MEEKGPFHSAAAGGALFKHRNCHQIIYANIGDIFEYAGPMSNPRIVVAAAAKTSTTVWSYSKYTSSGRRSMEEHFLCVCISTSEI